MTIQLDHVFMCCQPGAPEADVLLKLGFVEGSRNVHAGQGTENRRFFFEGGFIELLWVAKPDETQSPLTSPTRLWPRWSGRQSESCPFGVAFSPAGNEVPPPPFATWEYRPKYLPQDKRILFAEGTSLQEPELFYMAWPHTMASAASQPKNHAIPLLRMLSVSVGVPSSNALSQAARSAADAGLLNYHQSSRYELLIEFASKEPLHIDLRPALPVILRGSVDSAI